MQTGENGKILSLIQQGNFEEARKLGESCIENGDAETWGLLAGIYAKSGQLHKAASTLEKSISIHPYSVQAHFDLARLYIKLNSFQKATDALLDALNIEPGNPKIHFTLANTYQKSGRLQDAENIYKKIIEIYPGKSGALTNLGLIYLEMDRPDEAISLLKRSLTIDPHQSESFIHLAKTYRNKRMPEKSVACLEKSIENNPNIPALHWDYSLALLETGNFSDGWKEYEWRWDGQGLKRNVFPAPAWNGENLRQKTILVVAEQGIGDEIMFSSCYSDLNALSKTLMIDCEPRLEPLFQRSFKGAITIPRAQSLSSSLLNISPLPDYCVYAGSLPLFLRNDLSCFPDNNAYMIADDDLIKMWHDRYASLSSRFTVGISWKGGHISQTRRRSTILQDWNNILRIPDINFVDIQYGDTTQERNNLDEIHGITLHHWDDSDALTNMDIFAAQLSALDLVISVDNSTVHLAGSLGVTTWILQSYVPDWRWMNHSDSSYWYSTVKQFHQHQPAQWNSVLRDVALHLEQHQATIDS